MSSKIVIQSMTHADIEQAAKISVAAFDEYNITMNKMGINYLKKVYFPEMISCDGAAVVTAMLDGKMLGYYCYQKDFKAFSRRLSKKNFFKTSFYLMLSVLKFKMSPRDIYNLLKIMSWIDRNSKDAGAQVGPIAVSPDIKGLTQGGLVSHMLIREVMHRLKTVGVQSCWSTVDSRNPSINISISFGFKVTSTKELWGAKEHFLVKKI